MGDTLYVNHKETILMIRKALLGLALGISLVLTLGLTKESSYVEYAYGEACRLSRYDCSGVPAPSVFFHPIQSLGPLGVYLGSNSVILDIRLNPEDDPLAMAVLIHEIVHYLQTVVDGQEAWIRSELEQCIVEGEAYAVSNAWLRENGHEDLTVAWEKSLCRAS